ncbi:MAG: hypothetical protein RL040_487 [Bacteroidota bacterium]|jgi:hypothetical protein
MKVLFFILVGTVLFTSCSQVKIIPSFTDVSHIEKLKPGMSKSDVSSALEVTPIDFYYLQDGVDVFVYNYRIAEKLVPTTKRLSDSFEKLKDSHIDGLAARNAGVLHYTEWRKLYVSYKGDKLIAMISDAGREDANSVLVQLASIQALQDKPQVKIVPHALAEENYIVPTDEKGDYILSNGVTINGANAVAPANSNVIVPNVLVPNIIVGPTEVITIPPSRENTKSIFKK